MLLVKNNNRDKKGFTLIESLIALSLFTFIVPAAMQFFAITQKHFHSFKDDYQSTEAAYSSLDKMRADLSDAGFGLILPISMKLLEGIEAENTTLTVFKKHKHLGTAANLVPGQTRIFINNTQQVKPGRQLCIHDQNKGEIKYINEVDKSSIVLSSSLQNSYSKDALQIILLKKVSFYLDEAQHILRRKVNSSPAQPLLEEASAFAFTYNNISHFLELCLCLNNHKEKTYETSLFLKNLALAQK